MPRANLDRPASDTTSLYFVVGPTSRNSGEKWGTQHFIALTLNRGSGGQAIAGFDGLDGVYKRLFQNALADGPEHQAEQPSLEVLALAYDDHVNIGRAVGTDA